MPTMTLAVCGNAWELIHGELAGAWAAVSEKIHNYMKKSLATSEIVAASTDALLGAVCKPSIDPSDNQALTSAWRIGQGRCDRKTALEQLPDLRWSSFKPNWTSMADLLCDRVSCSSKSRMCLKEILDHIECTIGPTHPRRSNGSWTS